MSEAATEAVPAQAIGHFAERLPAPFLRESFASVWMHRMPAAGAPPIVITPDATIDLQWIDGDFRIAGPDKHPQTENLPAGGVVIGFRFHVAAAARWLNLPAAEILGARLRLSDLWGRRAKLLSDRVRRSDDPAELLKSLEAAIAHHESPQNPVDPHMRAAHGLIEKGPPPGASLVPWLGRALAMSERTLRRRFDESFGYGPKTLDRILRFQRFRRLSAKSNASVAVLAAEAGYADQAHLVRESRRLTGSTPGRLDQLVRQDGQ